MAVTGSIKDNETDQLPFLRMKVASGALTGWLGAGAGCGGSGRGPIVSGIGAFKTASCVFGKLLARFVVQHEVANQSRRNRLASARAARRPQPA